MGIEGVNNQQQIAQPTAMPAESEVQEIVAEVAPLLSADTNLSVAETRATDKGQRTRELKDVPEIDEADMELLRQCAVDLEALLAYLQADQDEAQLLAAKARIQSLQGQLAAAHEESMNKVNESIDAMKEQEKSAKLNKILGWLGVVMAVAMAVVSVLTCGGAAAVCACVCAGLAVGMQVLNETGAMDDLVDAIAKFVQDCAVFFSGGKVSEAEAEAIAQMIIAAVEIAIAIACTVCSMGGGGAGVLKDLTEETLKTIKTACLVVGTTFSVAGIGGGIYGGVASYEANSAQADVTEMQGVLKKLQTMLDEETEEMQQLIQQLMDSLGAVMDLLNSKQDAISEITMNIGA